MITIALGILLAGAAAAAESPLAQILRAAFSDWMGDKAERLVLVASDGQSFVFSGQNGHQVGVNLGELFRTITRAGHTLATITDVVHSHGDRGSTFTDQDRELERILRSHGFAGAFRIYYPETRRILTLQSSLRTRSPAPAPDPGRADPQDSRK